MDTERKKMPVYDFTNAEVGDKIEEYLGLVQVCPFCGRNGIFVQEDFIAHVITVSKTSIWVSDRCDGVNIFVLSEPAKSLTNRVKHPFELKE